MIKVITGAMKSGKTARLIEIYEELEKLGLNPKIFYPACCEKQEEYIVSRNGKKTKAIKIFDTNSLFNHVSNTKSILLDEVQFIDNLNSDYLETLFVFLNYCTNKGIDVYCAGLDLDFAGNSFKITKELLSYADEVEKLKSRCDICGDSGRRTMRYKNDKPASLDDDLLCLEGDSIEYKTVCTQCYNKEYNK